MKQKFREYFFITIGTIIVALGIKFFIAPNNIAGGGVTGISIILYRFVPSISVAIWMLILNVFLFIIAFIFIGGKFGGKTIYATIALSGVLYILDLFFPGGIAYTDDLFLATVFGSLLSGIGLGMVFNQNASTGGTDILAKILNKFFHINMGKALLMVDLIVALTAGVTFSREVGMYAILAAITNGMIIDNFIEGLNVRKSIFIISKENKKIKNFIIQELDRGCTVFEGKGAYSDTTNEVVYTVLDRKQFIKLRNYIKDIDSRAFITVNEAHEVLGEGFKNIVDI